jgi:hypothetical protein
MHLVSLVFPFLSAIKAMYHIKPVFVVATDPPKQSIHYLMLPATISLNNFVEMLRIKNEFSTCKLQIDHSFPLIEKALAVRAAGLFSL